MPNVARVGPYRVFFYSNEGDEPPHVHVEREGRSAKFWLDPVGIASSGGHSIPELRRIERMVRDHRDMYLESWREFFWGRQ